MNKKDLDLILASSQNTDTVLSRIAVFIEYENQIDGSSFYWDPKLEKLNKPEKQFYKSWSWLSYIECEQPPSLKPIPELEDVFGPEVFNELQSQNLNFSTLKFTGPLGTKLLNWIKDKLEERTYNKM